MVDLVKTNEKHYLQMIFSVGSEQNNWLISGESIYCEIVLEFQCFGEMLGIDWLKKYDIKDDPPVLLHPRVKSRAWQPRHSQKPRSVSAIYYISIVSCVIGNIDFNVLFLLILTELWLPLILFFLHSIKQQGSFSEY